MTTVSANPLVLRMALCTDTCVTLHPGPPDSIILDTELLVREAYCSLRPVRAK